VNRGLKNARHDIALLDLSYPSPSAALVTGPKTSGAHCPVLSTLLLPPLLSLHSCLQSSPSLCRWPLVAPSPAGEQRGRMEYERIHQKAQVCALREAANQCSSWFDPASTFTCWPLNLLRCHFFPPVLPSSRICSCVLVWSFVSFSGHFPEIYRML